MIVVTCYWNIWFLFQNVGHGRILSTDQRDFGVYRWKQTFPFVNLMFP